MFWFAPLNVTFIRAPVTQVLNLCGRTRSDRQTLLFTATFDPKLEPFQASLQSSPLELRVTSSGPSVAASHAEGEGEEGGEGEEERKGWSSEGPLPEVPAAVLQQVFLCAEHKKPRRLLKLMSTLLGSDVKRDIQEQCKRHPLSPDRQASKCRRVLIFANKIKTVNFVKELLLRHGVSVSALTSRLTQAAL